MKIEVEVLSTRMDRVCPEVRRGAPHSRHRLILRAPHARGAAGVLVCGTCSVRPVTVHYIEVDEETAAAIAGGK